MLLYIYLICSLVGSVLTVWLTPIHHGFGILLFAGYFVAQVMLFFIVGIVATPFLSKTKELRRPNRFARFMLIEAYYIAMRFMHIRVHVTGKEKLPKRGTTFLVVCNHLSNYDHMIMLIKLRRFPIAFISKPENFNLPFVGRYLYQSGFISIDRKNARNALGTVNETARRISRCGMCYGVFPEGTRSRNGQLLPFHSGVFMSATKAKAPVLIIHMDGTNHVPHHMTLKRTHVKMEILDFLPSEYVSTHSDKEICEHAYNLMLSTGQEPYVRPERKTETPAETEATTAEATTTVTEAEPVGAAQS